MSEIKFPDNFLIFGCGNMGGAILRGWIAAGIAPDRFTVVDPYAKELPAGVKHFTDAALAGDHYDAVLLGIKPQMLSELSPVILPLLKPAATAISILAGAKCATISAAFPGAKIIRMMPNLAAELGKSPLGLWSDDLDDVEKAIWDRSLSLLGPTFWLPCEAQMDAYTALAGSGPAFLYRFIDTLSSAGAALGLDATQADAMALATVEGAVMLALQSNESPRDLAARVTSAGGSTAAGLAVLDTDQALLKLIASTLDAAARRNAELAAIAERT
jgi:pyrroline-5-carboxylate reductase